MDKIKTLIDKQSTKEFVHGTYVFSWVNLAVSLAMVALFVTFGIINNDWSSALNIILLVMAIIIFILAIIMIVSLVLSVKRTGEQKREVVYDFQDEEVAFEIFCDDQLVESGRVSYQDFMSYKETKNFVYLKLNNSTWFFVKKVDGLVDFIENKGLIRIRSIGK